MKPSTWRLAGALVLFLALAIFGARFHRVEEVGSAERDGYVAKAEQLMHGEIPVDPYRPLLYPLLVAGMGKTGLEPFVAARLLSNLAAAALVWLAFGFGRRLGGSDRAGYWAMALTAVNPNVWILGQHVATDMLFAALASAALLAGLAYLETPRARTALVVGAFLGLAGFVRGTAVFLVPGLLLAWWLADRPRSWRAPLVAALAAVALLAPHFWLRAQVFGDPVYSENFKNLAWKLYGYPDWSYLDRVPFASLGEIVRADPARVLAGGFAELWRFARGGLSQLLGTGVHALLLLAGATLAWGWRRRAAGWLLAASGIALVATAFVFFTWGRLLLYLLPVANGLGAAGLFFTARGSVGVLREGDDGCRRTRWADWLVLVLVALLAVKTFFFRLPAFVEHHPTAEIEALSALDRGGGEGLGCGEPGERANQTTLAGVTPFLGRYLEQRYVALPDAFGDEVTNPELYFEHLGPLLRSEGVRYLVAIPIDLRDRPAALLGPGQGGTSGLPSWLRLCSAGESVAVWQVELGEGASP
ncbi:MAG: glycosyltransferase family 39 protein [Acidobacteria bacterium]|nr:glycosyltransferase family 39 protein [Acidobacteriota bacterium]